MTIKNMPSQGPESLERAPLRNFLEILEQAVAGGWYPARRRFLSHLSEIPRPELPVWVPEADLEENPREFVVSLALPGVEKSDIRVEVSEESLAVSGRRRQEKDASPSCRREQPRGRFLRRLRLPAEVKPQGAKASYHNGVLRVTMPRSKAAFGRSVKVD